MHSATHISTKKEVEKTMVFFIKNLVKFSTDTQWENNFYVSLIYIMYIAFLK